MPPALLRTFALFELLVSQEREQWALVLGADPFDFEGIPPLVILLINFLQKKARWRELTGLKGLLLAAS